MMKTFLLFPLAAVFQGGTAPRANAQEQSTERKVRVEIVTTENGETKRVTKEFDAANEAEIQEALKEMGVLDHINMNGDGENVTIDIRRSGSNNGRDLSMHMAPMAPMPPKAPNAPFAGASNTTAYLGVSTSLVEAAALKELKVPVKQGLLVEEVVEGSAAAKAGLEEGDVITEVDGTPMASPAALSELIRAHEPGDAVKMTWYRDGKKKNATVELGKREVRSRSFSFAPDHGSEDFDWESHMGDGPWTAAPRAFLGVTPGDGDGEGATIGSVEEGTAAADMGLQEGDRITAINGTPTPDFGTLSATIKAMQPNDPVTITVQRDGQELTLNGTLGERSMERTYGFNYNGEDMEGLRERMLEWKGQAPEDRDDLRREMDALREEMDALRREFGKDRRVETRITIESMPLSEEEKDMLKSKGVTALDAELRLGDLRVFPNPSNGFFRIHFDVAEKGDLFVNVHDATGEKVYEERITGFKGRYERTLDLTDKATGTYFLVIQQSGKSAAQKLVKE